MRLRIEKGRASGAVQAPPSKSMAHRLLICAGLSAGVCRVHGVAESQDMLATMDCLEALGTRCERQGDTVTVYGGIAAADKTACGGQGTEDAGCAENTEAASSGEAENFGADAEQESCGQVQRGSACGASGAGAAAASPVMLRCRESGSTLRFLVPIALLTGRPTEFVGSRRLMQRPLDVYERLCKERGIAFEQRGQTLRVCGRLTAGSYELAGDVSSQFVTGLLLALPLLEGDSRIELIPPVESRSYIDMTVEALACFGVRAEWQSENCLFIKGGQSYKADELFVEGDYSNAAFFEALNILGSEVRVENLREDSMQGDRVYRELFERLVTAGSRAAALRAAEHPRSGGGERGDGNDSSASHTAAGNSNADSASIAAARHSDTADYAAIDISDCPDLGPILLATAAARGGGCFTGTKRLKIKESNRGEAMAAELRKLGVSVSVGENEITVGSEGLHEPSEPLDGHNDHRIVMSAAVLLTQTGGEIKGAEAVAKSFPDFFEKLASLGIEVKKIED